ncbi:lipase [Penicillium psychrosexuale]|uniref:lipase n=1 Tax=Penicillium psychrosexuale TaxID=1002107 RepID=UPI002545475F|nr:lipase [Penicillium psychrosexuale]KAJ5799996.1 lipase [Penicillium psychrosexuale]
MNAEYVAISPYFHATAEAEMGKHVLRMPRANGGDSAYVLMTTVYSNFNEFLPHIAGPNASDILGDVRGVHT